MTSAQLRAIRKSLHLSQEAFARLLGVSRVSVNRWESGRLPIDQRTQMAIEHLSTSPMFRVPHCTLCGSLQEQDGWVQTSRGWMHEDCAQSQFDHQDERDPGIPKPGM